MFWSWALSLVGSLVGLPVGRLCVWRLLLLKTRLTNSTVVRVTQSKDIKPLIQAPRSPLYWIFIWTRCDLIRRCLLSTARWVPVAQWSINVEQITSSNARQQEITENCVKVIGTYLPKMDYMHHSTTQPTLSDTYRNWNNLHKQHCITHI